jgi:putative hydrolase of the HAD superfamily
MLNKQSIQKYLHPLAPLKTSLTPTGKLRAEIKCVLFDIYGTLFISGSGDIGRTEPNAPQLAQLKELLAEYRIHKTLRTILEELNGAVNARHAALRQRGIDFPEVNIDQIWRQVLQNEDQTAVRQFAAEFEFITNPAFPMPHLVDLLTACRQQGILMGIISNAQFYTPCLFEFFLDSGPEGLGFSPDLIFYSYRFGVAKPSVALFEAAAAKLNAKKIKPAWVLYIGNDMLNDIYPAKLSGFQTALFAGDRRSLRLRADDPRCRDLTADLVVTDLGQLIRHIEQVSGKKRIAKPV